MKGLSSASPLASPSYFFFCSLYFRFPFRIDFSVLRRGMYIYYVSSAPISKYFRVTSSISTVKKEEKKRKDSQDRRLVFTQIDPKLC